LRKKFMAVKKSRKDTVGSRWNWIQPRWGFIKREEVELARNADEQWKRK